MSKFTLAETIKELKTSDRKEQVDHATTMLDLFVGGDEVPLSDELIEELVAEGWDRKELISAQKKGFRYNTSRESIVSPSELI